MWIYKLWFGFAKKRILGTESGYEYGINCVGSSIGMLFGIALSVTFIPNLLSDKTIWYFGVSVVFISCLLIILVSIALQKTVFILDLPPHLRGRIVSLFHIRREQDKNKIIEDSDKSNSEQIKSKMFSSADRLVDCSVEPAKIEPLYSADESYEGNSPVTDFRDRKKIINCVRKVGKNKSHSRHDYNGICAANSDNVRTTGKSNIVYSTGDGNCAYLPEAEWYRTFWLCRSCTHAATGANAYPENNSTKLNSQNVITTGELDYSDRDAQGQKCREMAKFMEKAGRVEANEENEERCKYLHYLVNQAPFHSISGKLKFFIWTTAPLWLFHLLSDFLFDRNIKVISPFKYTDWEAQNMGKFTIGEDAGPACADNFIGCILAGILGSFCSWMIIMLLKI